MTISDQDIQGLRIVLPESVSVNGKVIVDENAASLLRGIRVLLRANEPTPTLLASVAAPRTAVPDPRSGEFVLQNLSDGVRYSLIVNGLPADGYVHDVRLNNLSIFNEDSFVASTREQRLEARDPNKRWSHTRRCS